MARYLARNFPRCGDYLGVVLMQLPPKARESPILGNCARCRYRLVWKLITGKLEARAAAGHQSRLLKTFCMASLAGCSSSSRRRPPSRKAKQKSAITKPQEETISGRSYTIMAEEICTAECGLAKASDSRSNTSTPRIGSPISSAALIGNVVTQPASSLEQTSIISGRRLGPSTQVVANRFSVTSLAVNPLFPRACQT
jgi:hypothetical protein